MSRSLTPREHQIFTSFNSKLTLIPHNAVSCALLKDNRHFACQSPVVYKIDNTDAFLVFGTFGGGYDINRIKEELEKMQKEKQETDHVHSENCSHQENKVEKKDENKVEKKEIIEINDEKLNEDDISAIVEQTNCTREEAINALIETDFDLIEALLKVESNKNE